MSDPKIFSRFFKYLLPTLIFILAVPVAATPHAGNDSGEVLIINSYAEATPWSGLIIDRILSELPSREDKPSVVTEHLHTMLINTPEQLDAIFTRIDQKYTQSPRLVIFIGNSGWSMLHSRMEDKWPEMRQLLFSETSFTGPVEFFLQDKAIPLPEQVPFSRIAGENPNFSAVCFPSYMEETIRLMYVLIPGMERLLLLSDQRWISAQARADMARTVSRNFPKLELGYLTEGEDVTTDALLDSLHHTSPANTGVIFFSWIQKDIFSDNITLTSKAYKVIGRYADFPMFALTDIDVTQESNIVGGYFPTREDNLKAVSDALTEVLDGRYGFVRTALEPGPVFNYRSLQQAGLNPELLPKDSVFFDKPQSFFSQYRIETIATIVSFVFLLLLIYLLLKSRSAQKKKIATNASYRNLFDHMPIAFIEIEAVWDASGSEISDFILLSTNPTALGFFRKDISEIVGKRGSELKWDTYDTLKSLMKQVIREKHSTTLQYYNPTTERNFNIILSPSDKKDVVNLFFSDNTELSYAQQQMTTLNHKLTTALGVAEIIVWKWDLKKEKIVFESSRDLPGAFMENASKMYYDLIHDDDRQRIRTAYNDLIRGAIHKIGEEYRVLTDLSGSSRYEWVEVHAMVDERDEKGDPLSLVGSAVIITRRKEIEEALLKAKLSAEESNRLKSAFLANMSHEIRTPLNAIVGFSAVLAATENEQDKQEYLGIIESNNALLLQLIGDILDLSKIEAGTLEFVYSDVSLNMLLEEAVQVTRLKIASEAVSILEGETVPECTILTDRNRLMQVLTNLITNALKFTPEGTITAGFRKQDEQTLCFYVKDTGCGIPADKLGQVFGRFVKLDNVTQGTGLGLSICQTIIRHLGGEIGVESIEGEGTVFWFTIPYKPIEPIEMEGETAVAGGESKELRSEQATLLVAEDNEDNYRLFKSILGRHYNLIHAWNGQEAVELYEREGADLIVMDISMPVMDGYQALTEIRKNHPDVLSVAVTAFAFASDQRKIKECGFNDYIPKPLDATVLKDRIARLLPGR